VEEHSGNNDETIAATGSGSRQKGHGDTNNNGDDRHSDKSLPGDEDKVEPMKGNDDEGGDGNNLPLNKDGDGALAVGVPHITGHRGGQ
jgi:hypothetical protein